MAKNNSSSSIKILHKLYLLRNVTVIFVLMMVAMALFVLDINLPIIPISIIMLLMITTNVVTRLLINFLQEAVDIIIFSQLLIEVLLFSFVLFFTGGATNPVTFFYLIPLAIAATIIPGFMTWVLTLVTIVAYSILLKYYIPLNHQGMDHASSINTEYFHQHILGMWVGFLVSAILITWFITYLSKELKQHKQNLADEKQREMRNQQIITMGTLAVGTAHELGTPLASLAIVAGEITNGFNATQYPQLFENQKILLIQVKRCKKIISALSDSTGNLRADAGHLMSIDIFFKTILDDWLKQRANIDYKISHKQQSPCAKIIYDKTLSQAIINLLNNATDESVKPIEIYTDVNAQEVIIEIIDSGHGMSDAQIALAGKMFFSNKPHGVGVGLFLALTTIQRNGGSVNFAHRGTKGTKTLIKLPLIKLGNE